MSSSNLSKFAIFFTRSKHTDEGIIRIAPAADDSYSVTFALKETADQHTDNGPTENVCTESWICPKANIRQYVRNCVTVVIKDGSAQRFTHMELQIPMFPTCLVEVRGSSVDQILNIAFEHLDLISADDAKNWPTRANAAEEHN